MIFVGSLVHISERSIVYDDSLQSYDHKRSVRGKSVTRCHSHSGSHRKVAYCLFLYVECSTTKFEEFSSNDSIKVCWGGYELLRLLLLYELALVQCVKFDGRVRRGSIVENFWLNLRPNFHRRLKIKYSLRVMGPRI